MGFGAYIGLIYLFSFKKTGTGLDPFKPTFFYLLNNKFNGLWVFWIGTILGGILGGIVGSTFLTETPYDRKLRIKKAIIKQ